MNEDWERQWQPLVARVGEDFAPAGIRWGADHVELGAVRRYVEVLELDCPLHFGPDAVAPSTSLGTWTLPAMRGVGEPPIFTSDARNAEPERSPLKGARPPMMPPTTAYMATDHEVDYLLPVRVGDRLGRRGNRLVRCEPKATKVGRGAFTTWEYEIVNQHEQVVARCRFGMYHYEPHAAKAH